MTQRSRRGRGTTDGAPALLTTSEAAAILGVNPKTVARWGRVGKLDSIRTPGGHRRFSETQVRSLAPPPAPG